METWLKALIGTASAVVIVGGGYFAYGERQEAMNTPQARYDRQMAEICRARQGTVQAISQANYDRCKKAGVVITR